MVLTLIISLATVLSMASVVLIKPYIKIKRLNVGLYWLVCLVGALLLLATGCISFNSVISGITANTSVNPLKILTLFLSMTLLSVYLGDAGFFDYIADGLFRRTKGSQLKLFLGLYFIVSVLTVFTSNDVIILTFTPAICIFAKKANVSALPYLVAEFIGANTWSMALIVGNPTNVYLAQSAGIGFYQYFSVMWLPTLVGGLAGLLVLLVLFYKQLKTPISHGYSAHGKGIHSPHGQVKIEKPTMIIALLHLLACIFILAVSDFIGVEMWLVCLVCAISLSIFDLVYDLIKFKSARPVLKSLSKEPYELAPFILSMFVIVLALKENGITDLLNGLLVKGVKTDGVSLGFISALSSNLLNNIPMSVLFEKVVTGNNLAVFGVVVGSNIGAFITPVGALAGIMWNKILVRHNIKLPFKQFVLYGVSVAIPTLCSTLLTLLLVY